MDAEWASFKTLGIGGGPGNGLVFSATLVAKKAAWRQRKRRRYGEAAPWEALSKGGGS